MSGFGKFFSCSAAAGGSVPALAAWQLAAGLADLAEQELPAGQASKPAPTEDEAAVQLQAKVRGRMARKKHAPAVAVAHVESVGGVGGVGVADTV
ncbi:hypothetical protein B484DRAFT_398200 [Ochromonadaceae sp. CCMP2298]|nr:hypothetical protein B484DRAFT_398200 [Ochromonadaceae sp. CCMP2298]